LVTGAGRDKLSQHSSEDDEGIITPIFDQPENVILGEHGLIKHTVLNNRRMVVTEDKCGEVALWDLIKVSDRGYFFLSHVQRSDVDKYFKRKRLLEAYHLD